ncbi:hypothetical protein [Streptomyces sp. SHP 1-2]|uniref:hypothetical protein n=1 Tax=Streptomyces sp. SHP 1-2 TaxID=2769489 RepID=UPI002237BCC3|nr:hypothetical protein [Streptomyces sp. SHP 1-2]MCW5254257.1 hypothetical protein [Streptomyces sp. SHP 1-2]
MTSTTARRAVRWPALLVAVLLGAGTACSGSGGEHAADGHSASARPDGTVAASAPADPTGSSATGVPGGDVPAEQALRAVERALREAGSARVESSTVIKGAISLEGKGTIAWRNGFTGVMTLRARSGTAPAVLQQTGTEPLETRYLSDGFYSKPGGGMAAALGDGVWLRYGYEELGKLPGGPGAGFAGQMRDSTPDKAVAALLANEDLRRVGEERVRGRGTTHWVGTVTSTAGSITMRSTVDIWVDDRDLLVKRVERGNSPAGELFQTAYYSDYGIPVSVEAPPAADTVDFVTLLRNTTPRS